MDELRLYTSTNPAVQVKEQNTFTPQNSNFKIVIQEESEHLVDNSKLQRLRFHGFFNPWKATTLGKISTWSTGSGLQKDTLNYEGRGDRAIHYGSLFSFKEYIFKEDIVTYTDVNEGKFIPINSLLFARKDVTPYGLARTSAIDTPNVKAAEAVMIANLDKEVDATFVSYQLNKNKHYFIPYITGTSIKGITSADLKLLKVSLPSLTEQQKIGNFFKDIDKKIKALNNAINDLTKLKESLRQKVFPKRGKVQPEIRFEGFIEDWKETILKNICTWYKGKDLRKEKLNKEGKGDRAIHYGSLFNFDDYIEPEEIKTYTEYDEGVFIPLNSLLFARISEGTTGLAKASAINTPNVRAGVDVFIAAIQNDNDASFVASQINRDKNAFLPYITGITIMIISTKGLDNLKVLLPSLEEQLKISSLFKDLEALNKKLIKQKANYEVLKQALLQRMFV